MGTDQRKQISNDLVTKTFIWISRGVLAFGIWVLSQIYSDFQSIKSDIEQLKLEVSSMKASLGIMERYDLKPKQ